MAAPTTTYNSPLSLELGAIPNDIETPEGLYKELLAIHNAIEGLIAGYNQLSDGELFQHQHWLPNLQDVTITPPVTIREMLGYDTDSEMWVNKEPVYQLAEAFPTGLVNGGELNIGPGANDIEVIAGIGVITNSYTNPMAPPVSLGLEWDQVNTPITAMPAVAGNLVWFAMEDTGTFRRMSTLGIPINESILRQYSTPPMPTLTREQIFLGVAIHNGTAWKEISNPKVVNQVAETLRELLINVLPVSTIIEGGTISEVTNLKVNQATGTIWENNRNWHNSKSNPNRETLPASTPVLFKYINNNFSIVGSLIDTFDPSTYAPGGVLTPVPGGSQTATIQKLYLDPANNYWTLYGEYFYTSFEIAIANLQSDLSKSTIPFILQHSILLGYIIAEKNRTDWNTDAAVFIPAISAGGATGGTPVTDHSGLSGVLPNQHHNQAHLFYGPDQSDVDTTTALVTGAAPVFLAAADGGNDKFHGLNTFVSSGYGGIVQDTPLGLADFVIGYQVIPANAIDLTTPKNVTQDFASNGLRLNAQGIWLVSITVSLTHGESNSGRQINVQVYNNDTSTAGFPIPVPIARNQPGTLVSITALAEVPASDVGNLFQVRMGGGDIITNVDLEVFKFSAAHISEYK